MTIILILISVQNIVLLICVVVT